ncbi:hypothetical protein JQ597_10585 [Bradyrhizobium sp. AUGA SZCCT0177]|nr:hypothetical protein [Bradyrhizobium sp. AUGA SZCCT0177]MBR1282482.1 hypothetical protein [Bradyrhizobium sp. AUGA SZCCT0177]
MTNKAIIAIAVAISLTAGSSFGQQADDDAALQQYLSDFRACVRSNAAEVYALGIRATHDAEEIFRERCTPTLNDLFGSIRLNEPATSASQKLKLPAGALRPGILRITAREEWAAFLHSASGK